MTPLDQKLVKVTSLFGRTGPVKPASGDYNASKIAYSFPTGRWDGLTRTNARQALDQLGNAHPTNGLGIGRGVHDDFVSSNYVVGSTMSVAAENGGPLTSASGHLSSGLCSWMPESTGSLRYRGSADGCGSWAINTGATAAGGGLLYFPVPGTWATSSRYAIRMTCKLTFAAITGSAFIGLTRSSSLGSAANVLSNEVAGFHFPGTFSVGSYRDMTQVLPGGNIVGYTVTAATTSTFKFAITFSPTRGTHLAMWSTYAPFDVDLYDPTPSGLGVAFAVATRIAPFTNYDMLTVDYMGYSLIDLG